MVSELWFFWTAISMTTPCFCLRWAGFFSLRKGTYIAIGSIRLSFNLVTLLIFSEVKDSGSQYKPIYLTEWDGKPSKAITCPWFVQVTTIPPKMPQSIPKPETCVFASQFGLFKELPEYRFLWCRIWCIACCGTMMRHELHELIGKIEGLSTLTRHWMPAPSYHKEQM